MTKSLLCKDIFRKPCAAVFTGDDVEHVLEHISKHVSETPHHKSEERYLEEMSEVQISRWQDHIADLWERVAHAGS